jgi:hypothetical protein
MIIRRRQDGGPLRELPPILMREIADHEADDGIKPRIVDADPDEYIVIMRGPKHLAAAHWRHPIMMIEETTSAEEIATSLAQAERFERNADWLEEHGEEIFAQHGGKYVCVAGQEPFVAASATEAIALAKAAHPEDDGRFLYRVPTEKTSWVYANYWSMVSVP